MLDALTRLQSMVEGLSGTVWQQVGYLLGHFDSAIGKATWQAHVPTFSLDAGGIVIALGVGVACWAIFHLLWWLISGLVSLISLRMAPPPPRLP
jgi:hypothetical protein